MDRSGFFGQKTSHAGRIGQSKRFKDNDTFVGRSTDASPGPGAYGRAYSSLTKKGAARIGGAPRFSENSFRDSSYAAASLNLSSSEAIAATPGPAAYRTTRSSLNHTGATIGRSPRRGMMSGDKEEGTPGPAAYNSFKGRGAFGKGGGVIARTGRDAFHHAGDSPGPCAYRTANVRPHSASATIGRAPRAAGSPSLAADPTPGPAAYRTPRGAISRKGGTITRAGRERPAVSSPTEGPGPGAYTPMYIASSRFASN